MVVFGKKWLYSVKVVVFEQKRLHSGKICSIPESGSIWAKLIVFGLKLLYSDKLVVFGESGGIWA